MYRQARLPSRAYDRRETGKRYALCGLRSSAFVAMVRAAYMRHENHVAGTHNLMNSIISTPIAHPIMTLFDGKRVANGAAEWRIRPDEFGRAHRYCKSLAGNNDEFSGTTGTRIWRGPATGTPDAPVALYACARPHLGT